jgi:hypothetical protein
MSHVTPTANQQLGHALARVVRTLYIYGSGAGVEMTSAKAGLFCQSSAEGGCCASGQRRRRYRLRCAQRVGRCPSVVKFIRIEVWRQSMSFNYGQ